MAKKKPYRFIVYLAARAGAAVLALLPRRWALALARGVGYLGYFLVSSQRTKILKNLKFAYGEEKSREEIEGIARKVLGNMLQTAFDFLRFTQFARSGKVPPFVETGEAFSFCKDILQEGKGLIIMTAHMGNWELLAGIFGMQGFTGAVVGRRIYYEPYNRWIVGLRGSVNVRTIYRDQAVRDIHGQLKQNGIVGLLPDQDMDNLRGVFVDFFGHPAYTSVAPVKLAMSTGAPLLPAFLVRLPGDRYKLVIGKPIRPKSEGNRDEAVRKYTEAWMRCFEEMIRQYPDQWAWMHDRWKTTPQKLASQKKEEVRVS